MLTFGSQRAWKGDLGIGEEVVTCKLYLGLAFTISTLEPVTIGCYEVGGGGVVGGVGIVYGDGVDRGVGGVDCGVVKAPVSTMIVSVPEKDRWWGARGSLCGGKGWSRVTQRHSDTFANVGVKEVGLFKLILCKDIIVDVGGTGGILKELEVLNFGVVCWISLLGLLGGGVDGEVVFGHMAPISTMICKRYRERKIDGVWCEGQVCGWKGVRGTSEDLWKASIPELFIDDDVEPTS
ncbi:hypothetical protein Tco_0394757 [Tanacetum coccineum]